MLENLCGIEQYSDTIVRGPLLDLVLLFTQLVHFSFCYSLVLAELVIQSVLSLRLRGVLTLSRCTRLQLVHVHISCVTMFVFLEPRLIWWSSKLWSSWPHTRCGIALRTDTDPNGRDCAVLGD